MNESIAGSETTAPGKTSAHDYLRSTVEIFIGTPEFVSKCGAFEITDYVMQELFQNAAVVMRFDEVLNR